MLRRFFGFIGIVTLGFVTALSAGPAFAANIVLDFDSVVVAPGSCVDATSYLGSKGVTFATVSGGAAANICNVAGSAITPASGSNVFFGLPAVTNTNEAYDLLFAIPLTSFAVTRATVAPHTSLPAWNAFAYDAADNLLSSITQPSMFPGPPAAVFTLTGPGIARIRIESFNSAARTFNHPPFDDMVLDVADVPEPATMALVAGALVLGLSRRRSRSRG